MKRFGWLILGIGCTGLDSDARPAAAVDTLPNGAVRVTNAVATAVRYGAGLRLEPELVLGEFEGDEAVVFASIAGLEADDEGLIYVLDRQYNELRIFAPDGRHVRTVGRAGQGPGEYTRANGLLRLALDTLAVIDQQGRRYSILTRAGDHARSVLRQVGFFGFAFDGGYDNGRIYERSNLGRDPDYIPVIIGIPLGPAATTETHTNGAASSTVRVDTVPLPMPNGALYGEQFILTNSDGIATGYMRVPFSPVAVYRLDGRGGVWHGHGREFRIVHSTLAGDTTMEVTLDAAAAPVTAAELQEWEGTAAVGRWKRLGGPLDMDRIPAVKPFLDALSVGQDGELWVSVPAAPAELAFEVFDADGRYLDRVQAAGFQRHTHVPHVIRNDRLYVAGHDVRAVEQVRVFRIVR